MAGVTGRAWCPAVERSVSVASRASDRADGLARAPACPGQVSRHRLGEGSEDEVIPDMAVGPGAQGGEVVGSDCAPVRGASLREVYIVSSAGRLPRVAPDRPGYTHVLGVPVDAVERLSALRETALDGAMTLDVWLARHAETLAGGHLAIDRRPWVTWWLG